MIDDLAYADATELIDAYRAKRLSPVEATRAALDAIAAHDPVINAYCLVDEDAALAAARASEARWARGEPLGLVDGVPTSVKDLVITRGWPTLRGSLTVDRDQPWDEDAPAVARLRAHGAVLLGKTTTPEFGWKGSTASPLRGFTRNPWNPEKTPGGSSGGASAALAAGMGALAIGTDAGGSIRIPASFAGVFGLKPSFGRVPAYPPTALGTLSHTGPMTRSVADAALMLTVMAAPDARDWTALPVDDRDYSDGLDAGVEGLLVGFSPTLGYVDVDPEVSRAVAAAARAFADLGAEVEEVDPGFSHPGAIFRTLALAAFDHALGAMPAERKARLDPGLVRLIEAGGEITLDDYLAALDARAALGLAMNRFHERYDLLLTPTLPITAFAAERFAPDSDDPLTWVDWLPFTYAFNLTQHPAASIPCGLSEAGLPIGLQIIGPRFADALVLRAARAYETVSPMAGRRAPIQAIHGRVT